MSSFVSSMVWAAPLIEMLRKAAGVEPGHGYEALDDEDGGRFTQTCQQGACWFDIGMTCTMNLIPSASWHWTGISFGFCPQFRGGWTGALVSIGTLKGSGDWVLEYEVQESQTIPRGDGERSLPEDVWRWYIDSAKALLKELGIDADKRLKGENLPIGNDTDAMAAISRAVTFFLARAQTAPFDPDKYTH